MLKVLIIEDDFQLRHNIADYLLSYEDRFEVLTADSGERGMAVLGRRPDVDVLLTDVWLPGVNGIMVLQRVAEKWPKVQIVVMTGFGSKEIRSQVLRGGALRILDKPLDLEALIGLLEEIAGSSG